MKGTMSKAKYVTEEEFNRIKELLEFEMILEAAARFVNRSPSTVERISMSKDFSDYKTRLKLYNQGFENTVFHSGMDDIDKDVNELMELCQEMIVLGRRMEKLHAKHE